MIENEICLNIKYIKVVLENIKVFGIVLVIDDFGIGMSLLFYLVYLNVDVLKIDWVFVMDIEINIGYKVIVVLVIILF